MMKKTIDVAIIGGGVTALSAAIFSTRRNLSTCIIAKDLGGQTATTAEIENYPGIGRIEGPELIARFWEQARSTGAERLIDEVTGVERVEDNFIVHATSTKLEAATVILAFGKTPRDLGIPGEATFRGKGVHASFLTERDAYAGKPVAVVGGGNSAFEAALALHERASHVYLVHRRDEFRGEQILLDRIMASERIERLTPYAPKAICGDEHVRSLVLTHVTTGIERVLEVDAVFPAIGFVTRSDFLNGLVSLNEQGNVMVSPECATSCPGIFAAGDITSIPYQQIVISAGEGAKAALSAYCYLAKRSGTRPVIADWGFTV